MTAEKKDVKKSTREDSLKMAEELGIETKGLSDEQLLFKVITELNKANSQLATSLAENETRSLKKYISGIETKVKDEEFLTRMMNLNIPNFYLHIFSDDDAKKTDKELWTMINKSGINPFSSIKEMLEASNFYAPPQPLRN
jgi:hypothetical protein